jgi:hypothetical protein
MLRCESYTARLLSDDPVISVLRPVCLETALAESYCSAVRFETPLSDSHHVVQV